MSHPDLPDRYDLNVRLGVDGDIEEWLASDRKLDRPVLVRILAVEDEARRRQFLDGVAAAAAVNHNHIVDVYDAGDRNGVAFSVSEWSGGVTLADRIAAGEPVSSADFLPNAAGLAAALAALHEAGSVHGAIDESAIFFSAAHPAKLGAFGRRPVGTTPEDDTRMLAETLERSLTGGAPDWISPSDVVDTIDHTVDMALVSARTEEPDARRLASNLRAAPSATRSTIGATWSWEWVRPAGVLAIVAAVLVLLGLSFAPDGGDLAVPSPPTDIDPAASSATTPTVLDEEEAPSTIPEAGRGPQALSAQAFDPFGTGGEHDELAGNVIDGDFETVWRTESYFDPLPRLKPGVGIAVLVDGTVGGVQGLGIPDGSAWTLLWAPEVENDISAWTPIATGTVRDGGFDADVQPRRDGAWLLWFTDLPASDEGTYTTRVAEVRFRP